MRTKHTICIDCCNQMEDQIAAQWANWFSGLCCWCNLEKIFVATIFLGDLSSIPPCQDVHLEDVMANA